MKFLSFSLFILVLFTGCIETIEAPWNTKVVPVVYSVITPGYPVQVYVGKSFLESDSTKINPFSSARVFVCGSDSNWIELKQSTDSTIYTDTNHSIQVQKGKTYSLRIEMKDLTLRAKTTVPGEPGIISQVECKVNTVRGNGVLNVKYTLPTNHDLGCYLSTPTDIYRSGLLFGNSIQEQIYNLPPDSTSFQLDITTTDSYLKKYIIAESIYWNQGFVGIQSILLSYGGVSPAFSNIQNGIGLFGSFTTESKRVEVTKITE